MFTPNSSQQLPFKSVALALIFAVLLGPLGLLYASLWGGILMLAIALVVVSAHYVFPIVLVWIISCIVSVAAVESYNRRLLKI